MSQREAFEAHIERTTGERPFMIGGAYNNVGWRKSWEGWQAAIQHARDVAVKKCAEISEREHRDFKGLNPEAPPGKRGNSYVEGLSDGADLAADAIKEALK